MPSPRLLCAASVLLLAACATQQPKGVVTDPAVTAEPGSSGPAATIPPGPQEDGVRTVLSPLGLNIRSGPSTTEARLAAAAQGAELTVLGYNADNGGWYDVNGATVTGWITADPSLSAAGSFTTYASTQRGFAALYPVAWTFAEETGDVIFRPQSGGDTVVVRTGASAAALGSPGAAGYTESSRTQVIVCGTTGDVVVYDHSGQASPSAIAASAPLEDHLAEIRLRLDSKHAMVLDLNYVKPGALETFADIYNSMTFAFPQCQLPGGATPSPA